MSKLFTLYTTDARASEEVNKLLRQISPHKESLNHNEWEFVSSLYFKRDNARDGIIRVSAKQLYWLRDIAAKFY